MSATIVVLIFLVAANLVRGDTGGIASLVGLGRPVTWLLTLLMLIVVFVIIGVAQKRRWDGVLIDERNKVSLSRVQIVLWTVLLVSALFTAGLSNVSVGVANPLEIQIPASVWALLGIGSFSFVASSSILGEKQKGADPSRLQTISANLQKSDTLTAPPDSRGQVVTKATPGDARWLDIIRGDTNDADYVDISKVQQLTFTALLLIVYGSSIFNVLKTMTPVSTFPPVDGGFVSLLGLSHAAYLAYKAVPK
ncbi:hypothetical protein HL667_23465 [Bradyrhizobium sp. 83012]|uniref:Uncharacterized protein n=1 Tax=Bradyrhizobium aeschynomenes TaxID=2734909 RepID=A0ABX2CJP3_9BRAD|nr:hypothetical protein [Bradyrhizobium aeschynomenes]NPU67980.1 hypothetical protein [Bradyrhizobium aeschynomenes]